MSSTRRRRFAPVFETILDKAHSLCGAERGTLFLYDGDKMKAAVAHGYPNEVVEYLRAGVDCAASRAALRRQPCAHCLT